MSFLTVPRSCGRVVVAMLMVGVSLNCRQTRVPAPLLAGVMPAANTTAAGIQAIGWRYVDREGIDSVMGTFVDSKTALAIKVEEALFPNEPRPWARDASEKAGYHKSRGSIGSLPFEEAIKAASSECDEVIVTLAPDGVGGRSLNLRGEVCDARQRTRFQALITHLASPNNWPSRQT